MNAPTPRARIVILHHERQPKEDQEFFLLAWVAKLWSEDGYEVHHLYGTQQRIEADLAFLHVDVSVVPDEYLRFVERYPKSVNLALRDIRKRNVSDNLVGPADDYDGPVIVKTDLNHGGTPEVLVGAKSEPPPMSRMERIKRRIGLKDPMRMRGPADYLIYERKSKVPGHVFDNQALVVERFLPEQHGDEYYHRRYLFLGDAERNDVWATTMAINASDREGDRTWTEPVPAELRARRRSFGADYGKIDYVIRDGQIEIFDINRTPTGTVMDEDPVDAQWARDTTDALADGIKTWLSG